MPDKRAHQKANDADTWLRHLLYASEITSDLRLHPNAFDKLVRLAPTRSKWKHGFSGRLKSVAKDVEAYAVATASAQRTKSPLWDAKFRGVMYASVSAIRAFDGKAYDVIHFYKDDVDTAHAGMIREQSIPLVKGVVSHQVKRDLVDLFAFAAAGTIELHRFLHPD